MKLLTLYLFLIICLFYLQSCDNAVDFDTEHNNISENATRETSNTVSTIDLNSAIYSDTKGMNNGKIYTLFDCPDAKYFPPMDIKTWDKTPVVNGRLPTYEETHNGMSIHHYGGEANKTVKVYNMSLPRLASIYSNRTKLNETVVVIQIVYTPKDTVVGYRYLTGGCGGSLFHNFHFLTVPEIQNLTK